MALQIIGAGFGRTGTDSMKTALGMLGVGPCYHMSEVIGNEDRKEAWRAVAAGAPADWDAIFDGYRSTVDWPAAFFWRELAAHYPDAKILLTVRPAERWYDSMEQTILALLRDRPDPATVGSALVRDRVFGGNVTDRDHIIATYRRNIEEVQAAFGPDRLLTYEVGEGWERLCAFLGRPVPEVPFPHANDSATFRQRSGLEDAGEAAPGG